MHNKKYPTVITVVQRPGEGHPGKPVEQGPSQDQHGSVLEGERPPHTAGNVAKADRPRDEKRPRIKRSLS